MKNYSLSHLSNDSLLAGLTDLIRRDRSNTAALLAHIAEVDTRRLYLEAGYPSMFAYSVGELRLSEDSAAKRIHAARAARRFPMLFECVADGRLHLSGIVLLAPHLTPENVELLVRRATHRSKAQVEQLLADAFPRPDVGTLLQPVPGTAIAPRGDRHAPGHVHDFPGGGLAAPDSHAPGHVNQPGPIPPATAGVPERGRVSPLGAQRYALQVTIGQSTHDALRRAQDLLGPAAQGGDVAVVLDRALALLVRQLERRRCGASARPRGSKRVPEPGSRTIPAEVRRAVWGRDAGRCTFVGAGGHRCEARGRLEFDHIVPFARGGTGTVSNLRLRCRAHNQYEAERVFGAGFMAAKRAASGATRAPDGGPPNADVIPWLRELGFTMAEARRAADGLACDDGASLEHRVRAALASLSPARRAPTGARPLLSRPLPHAILPVP